MSDQRIQCYAIRMLALPAAVLLALSAEVTAADVPGIVASASGGYQATYGAPAYRTIEFTAIRDANNNTRGTAVLFNHTSGAKLKWNVTCLHVDGNVATMTGIVSRDNVDVSTEFPYFWLRVVDNGEGQQATDFVSPLFSTVVDFGCDFDLTEAAVPVEGGNIQVR